MGYALKGICNVALPVSLLLFLFVPLAGQKSIQSGYPDSYREPIAILEK